MKYPYEAYKGFSILFCFSGFLLGVASGLMQPFQIVLIAIAIFGFIVSGLGLVWARDACQKAGMHTRDTHPGRLLLTGVILVFAIWVCSHDNNQLFEAFYSVVSVFLIFHILGPSVPEEKNH